MINTVAMPTTHYRRFAVVAAALVGSMAACADRTVTTQPASTGAPTAPTAATGQKPTGEPTAEPTGGATAVDATDDVDLTEVEQLLRDTDADLTAADQDTATPEGDPSQ